MAEMVAEELVGAGLFGAAVLWTLVSLAVARIVPGPPAEDREEARRADGPPAASGGDAGGRDTPRPGAHAEPSSR